MSTVQIFLMISLVLGLIVGHSSATCADDCVSSCRPGPGKDISGCVHRCIIECKPPVSASFNTPNHAQHFCNLGCVSSSCAKINTKEKIGIQIIFLINYHLPPLISNLLIIYRFSFWFKWLTILFFFFLLYPLVRWGEIGKLCWILLKDLRQNLRSSQSDMLFSL